MGNSPNVDYDALAKKFGAVSSTPATVDYDALAKQFGAVSSDKPDLTEQNAVIDRMLHETGQDRKPSGLPLSMDWAQRAGSGALEFVKSQFPSSISDYAKSVLAPLPTPQGAALGVYEKLKQAKEQGVGPTLSSTAQEMVPFPVAKIAQQVGSGQIPEAVGTAGAAALELLGLAKVGPKLAHVEAAPIEKALTEKQASNFSAALEMGGNAPKGVMTHEEVSLPIVNDVRAEAARTGVTAKDFTGRKGYKVAADLTDGVRHKYDVAYRSLVDPIDEQPASVAALTAAKSVFNKMLGDASLTDALTRSGATNTKRLGKLAEEIASAQTIGDLDRLRIELNRLSSAFEGKPEAQQYQSPVFTKSLDAGADAIRNALYPEIAARYKGVIDEAGLRELQKNHGAAIQADRLMQGTANTISRMASEEAAPPPFREQAKRLTSPATYSRPLHAVGGVIQSLWRPSDVRVFNTRMQRVIEGAKATEGRIMPSSGPPPYQNRLNPPPTPTGMVPTPSSAGRPRVPPDVLTSEVVRPAQATAQPVAAPGALPPVPKLLTAGEPVETPLPPNPTEPQAQPERSSPPSGAKNIKPSSKRGIYEQSQAAGQAEGAAVPNPIEPRTPPAQGSGTVISVPGESRTYNARYQVRELEDVIPSHSGMTFAPNKKYALTNDRDYSNPVNQGKVIQNAAPDTFKSSYHITDNPDATNGPPIIDNNGYVYGGNGRTMILQRVYKQNGEAAQSYKDMLAHRARAFGLDPAKVQAMKHPILVREIPRDEFLNLQAKQNAITDFNKKGTAEMTPSERAIADSKRISQNTLDSVSYHLSEAGETGSLASILQSEGHAILDQLISDGVISPQERAAYATRSGLTDAGKERIGKLFIGRFFNDAAQMDNTPLSVRGKLERIVGPVAKSNVSPEWNLEPAVREAMDILEEMRIHSTSTVDDLLRQSSMFGESKYSHEAVELARRLEGSSKLELSKMAKKYAADATDSQKPMGAMFGEQISPQRAFDEAFGAPNNSGAIPAVPKVGRK